MKVLITGAAGKLGSVVAGFLRQEGFDIRATDRSSQSRWSDGPITPVNLLDTHETRQIIEGCTDVVHLGNHPNELDSPFQTFNENVTMNMNVFQNAADLGVRRIIFASTIQTMRRERPYTSDGPIPPSNLAYLPLDGDSPAMPDNPYSLSKVVSERMLQYFHEKQGLTCISLRFPYLSDPLWSGPGKRRLREGSNLDEAFAFLPASKAADLVARILRSTLRGCRTYFPALSIPRIDMPLPELIERFFPNVPLRRPLHEITSLVDTSALQHDFGWSPEG